jgi:predicted lipoprotein with Yx(FWY)xxD motif
LIVNPASPKQQGLSMVVYRSVVSSIVALIMTACAAVNSENTLDAVQSVDDSLEFASGAPHIAPEGVTLQPLGKGQGYELGAQAAQTIPRNEIAYTDANGRTLYVWADEGPEDIWSCPALCMKVFVPFAAPPAARQIQHNTFEEWSVVEREDGTLQWALNGKPLYTYVHDVDPGSVGGLSLAYKGTMRRNAAGRLVGGRGRVVVRGLVEIPDPEPFPSGWKPALFYPVTNVELPPGFLIKEVPDVAAFSLTSDDGHSLYINNEMNEINAADWEPVWAPLLAEPKGDFSFIDREDGIRQWAYRGKALYSFSRDMAPGYANGIKAGGEWSVAMVAQYYMPSEVSLQTTQALGKVLATSDGQTLYRRDGHILQTAGGHSTRRGQPPRPAVGRDIGAEPKCVTECDKWRPFLALDKERPQGFWEVLTRRDGTRQWVYQGYTLWTYDGDRNPGDMNGHDQWTIYVSDDPNVTFDIGTSMTGTAGLYWTIAAP